MTSHTPVPNKTNKFTVEKTKTIIVESKGNPSTGKGTRLEDKKSVPTGVAEDPVV